jgi:putative inorganic carbon (hco3(-)) transporter
MRPLTPLEDVRDARHRSRSQDPRRTAVEKKQLSITASGEEHAALASRPRSIASPTSSEKIWNLAFVGLLSYAFIEYSRLPEMYPVFQIFYLGKVTVILATVGYLVGPRVRPSDRSPSHSVDIAVSIFIMGNFLSACIAFQGHAWEGFLGALYYAIVYFLMTRILASPRQIRIFLFLVLLLNLKLAQHTVRSYFLDRSIGMSDMRIIMSGGAGEGVSSFFGNVADLGLAMAVVWGIVWALLVGKAEKKRLNRIFLMICFVCFFLAMLFCGSRGAVVGAAAIVLVALARSPKRIGAAFLAIIFVLGVWFVLPGASKERFRSAWDWRNDADASSRVTFWGIGLDMFEHNPVLGVGPGNFVDANPLHRAAHSVYIQVLSESGLVGTISFVAILVLFFRLNARTRKLALQAGGAGRRSFEYCLAFGLDLGMAGYLSSGAFLSVLYYPHLWILLGLSVALNKCCLNRPREQQAVEKVSQGSFASAAF